MKKRLYGISLAGAAGIFQGRLTVLLCAFAAVFFALLLDVPAVDPGNTIRVGYYENEVFQEGAREGAMKSGYAYEYYRKLSEYTGWKYEYVYGDYAGLYQMLLDGKIDLLAGLAKMKDREGLIGYPDAPMGSESYNLVKHASDESITGNPKTLEGKTIGVLESAVADVLKEFLVRVHVTAKIKTYRDYTALFADFDDGKLDVLAAEGYGAAGRANTEVLLPFGGSSYFLCVNIRRPDLLAKLNQAQSALAVEDPNFFHSLSMKYYPKTILARAFSPVEKQWLSQHHTLRIGFLEHYMPYSGRDSKGQVTGVVKDIIPAILKSLGISNLKVTYSGYKNYSTMIADLATGGIDVAFPVGGGLFFSEESGLHQTLPVTSMSAELVYKGAFTEKTTEHFAINENNRMQYYFVIKNYPKAKMTLYPSIEACLDAVLSGKVGCTTLNGLRANAILKNRKYKRLYLNPQGKNDDRCFGVVIGNKGLLKLLNRGLNVIGSDYVQKQSHLHMHALYSYRLRDVILDHLGLFVTLLLAVAALIVALLVRDIRRTRRQMAEKEAAGIRLEGTNRKLMEHTRIIEKQRQQEFELREQLEKKQNELEDALQMAQTASRAKTTFLSNMSHDIRTPMNAIIGFTELAAGNVNDTERVREYLETIEQSSEHLLSLINDVLDMSRIESGKMTLNVKEESLADIIRILRDIVHADVCAKQLNFRIETEDVRNELVFCDKLRLNQVLLNLLSNAIKYTPKGGAVSLHIAQKPGLHDGRAMFEFRVKDNGIGMSEEFAKTIFDPFTREDNSAVSAIQGTGLGMAIAKNIVEMMDGKISLSTKIGEGTEFVVSLEFRLPDAEISGTAIPELKDARSLVVTADAQAAQNIGAMLRNAGMRVESCVSGKEAVIRAEDAIHSGDRFKIFIIDRSMPDKHGIETVRRIRGLVGKDAFIFVLTGSGQDDPGKPEAADVNGYISQPLFPSDLRKMLGKFFGKASQSQPEHSECALSLKGKKILMVDDSELNLKIGVLLLQKHGMTVDTARSGQAAVDMVKEKGIGAYDFILMDVQMPEMDGYEATALLRKLPDGDKLKIFAFSANAFEEDKEKSLKAGMNGHITKPLKIDKLIEEFTRVLTA